MVIELSVQLENFYGINAWYNLTAVESIYIEDVDARLGVCLDFGDRCKYIHVNEGLFTDKKHRFDALQDIMSCVIDAMQYYGVEGEKHRVLTNDNLPACVLPPEELE